MPITTCAEFVVQGDNLLDKLDTLIYILSTDTLSQVAAIQSCKHLALRLGQPYIVPLSGESPGVRINLSIEKSTYVLHYDLITTETDWLLPSIDKDWIEPDRITGATAQHFRWYNKSLDICIDLNIICPPAGYIKGSVEEQYMHSKKSWENSIFALLPSNTTTKLDSYAIPEPSLSYQWDDKLVLCAWLISMSPMEYLRPLLIEPDDILGEDEDPDLLFGEMFATENEKAEIEGKILEISGRLLEPSKARHMFAIVADDPLVPPEQVLYRSFDLFTSMDIPSPVNPNSRKFIFTCCWFIHTVTGDSINLDLIIDRLHNLYVDSLSFMLNIDEVTQGCYIICNFQHKSIPGMESTSNILENILVGTENLLSDIEDMISEYFPQLTRATKKYWLNEYGILFRNNA